MITSQISATDPLGVKDWQRQRGRTVLWLTIAAVAAAGACWYLWPTPENDHSGHDHSGHDHSAHDDEGAADHPFTSFVDVTESSGLDFVHDPGDRGEFRLPESTAGGLALLDYDADGDLDVFCLQSGELPWARPGGPPAPPKKRRRGSGRVRSSSDEGQDGEELWEPDPLADSPDGPPVKLEKLGSRLYRNDGDWKFTDVTEQAGISDSGYGVAVMAADLDSDGFSDLYISQFGQDAVWHNKGDGTFESTAEQWGLITPGYNTGAAAGDVNGDGKVDIYVMTYSDYNAVTEPLCYEGGMPTYCGPRLFVMGRDTLFLNQGDGTWRDATPEALNPQPVGYGLAVIIADLDGDGQNDIYIANDTQRNFLYLNQGGGKLKESGMPVGVAFSANGDEQGSMGIALGDIDNDGDADMFVTNFYEEAFALYINDGEGLYEDRIYYSNIATLTQPYVGWSTGFYDFNNDGNLDLWTANGNVLIGAERFLLDSSTRQTNILAKGLGDGTFLDMTPVAGDGFYGQRYNSRGGAGGDLDNDGDIDLVVLNRKARIELLRNDNQHDRGWLRVALRGDDCHSKGLCARVVVEVAAAGGEAEQAKSTTLSRWRFTSQGFASSDDPRIHFGLGDHDSVNDVRVHWPCGRTESFGATPTRRELTLEEGKGRSVD